MKHLQLRRYRYYLHWNVPKELRDHSFFRGKAIYAKSLQTSDLQQARRMRDAIVSEFMGLLERVREVPRQRHFNTILSEIRQTVESYRPSDALCAASAAPLAPMIGVTPTPAHISLRKAVDGFIKGNEDKVHKAILSKARSGAKSLLTVLNKRDVPLSSIQARDVTLWLQSISTDKSDWTRKGYRSALSSCWEWCYLNKQAEGTNPFLGARFKSGIAPKKYEPFTHEQLSAIISRASPQLKALIKFGLVTGCRIGELVCLGVNDFEIKGNVHIIKITDGKTYNSIRGIPLPEHLWRELKDYIINGLWLDRYGNTSPAGWSAKFGRLKAEVTGERDKKNCFHSFRGMTITAYENAGIPEGMTSQIVGHSKQGLTLSYGLYSSGYNYIYQIAAVEKMLNEDTMKNYLALLK
ncbi:tyrosine-type recombinase/integrase [Aeromonas veronii]|uniref:tyrosine-type recombinase/integrase n=1 Tax=Aeromonas veronii TaxID=654 RepID=UPI003BA2B8D5